MVPALVDMSLDAERRSYLNVYGFDLKSMPITVSYRSQGFFKPTKKVTRSDFVRALADRSAITTRTPARIASETFELINPAQIFTSNIVASISFISDFHAIVDLTEGGGNIPPNTKEIVLSCEGKILSEIPVLTHETTLKCTTSEKVINPGVQTFIPPAVENSPYGGKPDKEFAGHGPCVNFSVRLSLDTERKKLSATCYMDAWECPDDYSKIRKDYTQAVGSKTITLYQAADDEKILSFNVQSYFSDRYIDTDHATDFSYGGGNAPVMKLEYTGDTKGSEAGTKTGVVITFRPISLQIEKCEYK